MGPGGGGRGACALHGGGQGRHVGGNANRVIARAAALAAELAACVGELPTPGVESPPAVEERALSTKEAAKRLGVAPYTLNQWCRLGRMPFRQDTPGGRRYYQVADLAAYEAAHRTDEVVDGVPGAYSTRHDSRPAPRAPTGPRSDPSGARSGAAGESKHRRPVGTGRASRRPTRGTRPYAPGADAWRAPPKEPKG